MYESRIRKELTAETALAIMGGQLQADTQAMRVPDGRRPDPAPLDNGRVEAMSLERNMMQHTPPPESPKERGGHRSRPTATKSRAQQARGIGRLVLRWRCSF